MLYSGETSTNRMSFRRNTESRFSREAKTNMFRMISLQQIAMQLPWNDILAKIVGGGGGALEFYFKFFQSRDGLPRRNSSEYARTNKSNWKSRTMNTYRKMGPPWGAQKSTIFRQKATNRMRFWRVTKSSFCALTKWGVPPSFLRVSNCRAPASTSGLNLRPKPMIGNYAGANAPTPGYTWAPGFPLNDILPA